MRMLFSGLQINLNSHDSGGNCSMNDFVLFLILPEQDILVKPYFMQGLLRDFKIAFNHLCEYV